MLIKDYVSISEWAPR